MYNKYRGMYLYNLNEKINYSFDRYEHPTQLQTWDKNKIDLSSQGTYLGFVNHGEAKLECSSGSFILKAGMYFSVPGSATVAGGGGFVCCRLNYRGMFCIGGPIEPLGRLCYIDGCSDSVLIAPPLKGDHCLNYLRVPKKIDQTKHTHPTVRIGIIVEGRGYCETDINKFDLVPGKVFVLHADQVHSFHTQNNELRIVIYHPDSDSGPSHDDHPMLNRTLVDGVSASKIKEIRTKVIKS